MALGTLMGGWRIVHTMGSRITQLKPIQGFCAETGGAITLFLATGLGVPVSTTHTITGAIVGVGAARRVAAVRWNVAQRIVDRVGDDAAGGGVDGRGRVLGFEPLRRAEARAAGIQILGSVTPCCPWYFPPRSLYDVSHTSSDSKKITCATPSLA